MTPESHLAKIDPNFKEKDDEKSIYTASRLYGSNHTNKLYEKEDRTTCHVTPAKGRRGD
jgi:hypothetical protein